MGSFVPRRWWRSSLRGGGSSSVAPAWMRMLLFGGLDCSGAPPTMAVVSAPSPVFVVRAFCFSASVLLSAVGDLSTHFLARGGGGFYHGIPVGWFRSSVSWPAAADLFSSLFLHRREVDERSSFVRRFSGAIRRWCCGNQQGWNPLVKMGDGACLPSCALRSGATAAMGSLYVWAMLCAISFLLNGLSVILGMYCALL
jgi:hypothetical protein